VSVVRDSIQLIWTSFVRSGLITPPINYNGFTASIKFVPKKKNKTAKNSGRGNSNSNDYDGDNDQDHDEANNKRGGRRRGDRRKDHSGKGPSQITFTLFVSSGVWALWPPCIPTWRFAQLSQL
jgi:hypothetical protein